jgi:hypothetical protein
MAARRAWQVFIMLGGLFAWAAQFTILYGATSTICALDRAGATVLGIGIIPATIIGGTVAALAAAAAVLAHALRRHRALQAADASAADVFMSQAAILISAFSLAAIAWHGLPAFILPACA